MLTHVSALLAQCTAYLQEITGAPHACVIWTAFAAAIGVIACYYALNTEWDRVPRLHVPLEEGTVHRVRETQLFPAWTARRNLS